MTRIRLHNAKGVLLGNYAIPSTKDQPTAIRMGERIFVFSMISTVDGAVAKARIPSYREVTCLTISDAACLDRLPKAEEPDGA